MSLLETILNVDSLSDIMKYCGGPLAGSLAGSFFAYKFTERREKQNRKQKKIESSTQALFILSCQASTISNIDKQLFSKFENNQLRHYNITPTAISDHSALVINIESISFLVLEKQGNLLGELFSIDKYFHSIISALQTRNSMHCEFQIRLEDSKVKEDELDPLSLDTIAGDRIRISLKKMTDDLYDMISKYKTKVKNIGDKLATELEVIFPGHKFIRFIIIE